MHKRMPIAELEPGMVITQITEQQGPVKIKKSGLVSSQEMVQGLIEMGVSEVEIDEDQTVELESSSASAPKQTHTQALLQGRYDKQHSVENEHTLRTDYQHQHLFLPSVQALPAMWRRYTRQAVASLLTTVLGLGMGFFIAKPALFSSTLNTVDSHTVSDKQQVEITKVNQAPTEKVLEPLDEGDEDAARQANDDLPDVENPTVVAALPAPSVTQVAEPETQEQGIELTRTNQTEDVETISPELLSKVTKVIEELDNESSVNEIRETAPPTNSDIQRIDQLPVRYMTTLPTMEFTAHMYASREPDRWVRVNGKRMQEGDVIDSKVRIIAIEPQRVVLNYQGEVFSMAALTDW